MTEVAASRTRGTFVLPSEKARLLARCATTLVVVLSSIGLLSSPIGDYDDSGFLLAARLVLAGRLPYVDFWANYGPFGYTFLALFLREIENPAVALRVSQTLLLATLALLGHWIFTRRWARPGGGELAVPLVVLALSTLSGFPSFLGLALALISLILFLGARNADSTVSRLTLAILGGAALALATLTRPAFGLYAAASVLLTEAALFRFRSGKVEGATMAAGVFFVASVVAAVLFWLLLYRPIPVQVAFESAVRGPSQLIGGGRYLEPEFLRRGPVEAFAASCAIAGVSLIWGFGASNRGARTAVVLLLVVGIFPLLFRWWLPDRHLSWLGLALFPPTLLLAFLERRTLRESPDLAAAALFGLAAAVFGHYSWTRPDAPHLLPSLMLASFGVALVWKRLGPWHALAALGLFLSSFHIATRNWPVLPMGEALKADSLRSPISNLPGSEFRWRCEELLPDVARAVSLADRNAEPGSRFVAVASNHLATQGNPVLVFLISARLPYTRWFHYAPGVQTSPRVQREMERELLASGSRTAVVWRADRFLFDRKPIPRDAISRFDEFFNRLYPVTIARFGDYEVRAREPIVESRIRHQGKVRSRPLTADRQISREKGHAQPE